MPQELRSPRLIPQLSKRRVLLVLLVIPLVLSTLLGLLLTLALDRLATFYSGSVVFVNGTAFEMDDGSFVFREVWTDRPRGIVSAVDFAVISDGRTSGSPWWTGPISTYYESTSKSFTQWSSAGVPTVLVNLPTESPVYRAIDQHIRRTGTAEQIAAWTGTLPAVDRSGWFRAYRSAIISIVPYVGFSCAAWLGWRELRKHRRAKCGRCPPCGYNLRGELDEGCPECGWNRSE